MSFLFRMRSLQRNIDRFDELRAIAKRQGLALTVRNVSTRNIPVFMFTLAGQGSIPVAHSHDMDVIEAKLKEGAEVPVIDRAPDLAKFLFAETSGMPSDRILEEVDRRWPQLTQAEFKRGFLIAMEMKEADLAENRAVAGGDHDAG